MLELGVDASIIITVKMNPEGNKYLFIAGKYRRYLNSCKLTALCHGQRIAVCLGWFGLNANRVANRLLTRVGESCEILIVAE
jgi:hypothetical protein